MEQAEVLWNHGVELGQRVDEEHRITLYQIHGFYLEVYHHIQDDVVKRYRSFSSVAQLAPYIDNLNISDLL